MNRLQWKHAARLFSQYYENNNVSIIGGYHGVNLGDMALGYSVKEILKLYKFNGGLQTIYSLDTKPWKKSSYAIIGGGAVGYKDSLNRITKKYSEKEYDKIAFLGVDFNEKEYKDEIILTMLKKVNWISCRNINQAKSLETVTGRKDIKVHPDLAFALCADYCKEKRKNTKREKLLLMNIVPLYGKIVKGNIQKDNKYKNERPELYQNYEEMVKNYFRGIRLIAEEALEEGYRVETVPFTPGDEQMGKIILKNINVKHHRYTDNAFNMLETFSKAEKLFATRYHATIFGMKLGLSIIPMAYAKKNEYLLEELEIKKENYLTAEDLANGELTFPPSFVVDENKIINWEKKCVEIMRECITNLLGHTRAMN